MLILAPDIKSYCDEKIKLFRDKNMWSAPKVEIVGVLSGYELISTERNCGGFCRWYTKEIALNQSESNERNMVAIFHEMSHAFKYEMEKYEKQEQLLSEKLRDEVQTDQMTKYMTDKLFPDRFSAKDLNPYTWSMEDAQFLLDWYGDWVQNDLMI